MKLAVIGGGSTYTPELVDGLIRMRDLLPLEELALMDPAEERLAILAWTSVVRLTESTRSDNVAAFPEFASADDVPEHGVSVGLGTIDREAVGG